MNLEKIRGASERVARSEGLEVFDVEWKIGKQRFLRVYIDRVPASTSSANAIDSTSGEEVAGMPADAAEIDPYGAISHADCERVSQQLSVILDVEGLIEGPGYILEVSSPGLDRALRGPADFDRFAGKLAKITTSEPIGDMSFFEGRLAGIADGKVRLELKGKDPRVVEVPLGTIRKANLVVEW